MNDINKDFELLEGNTSLGISKLRLSNFKSISAEKPQEIELSPLTLLCGENSSGKSTLLHSILLLLQAFVSSEESAPILPLNGKMIQLSNYRRILHADSFEEHSPENDKTKLHLGVNFNTEKIQSVRGPFPSPTIVKFDMVLDELYPPGTPTVDEKGNYDLTSHQKNSGKDLTYFDSLNDEKYLPSVIEPAGGLTRTLFALLLSVYDEEKLENDEKRTVFRFTFELAPIQIGILPLSKKDDLIQVCSEINKTLKNDYRTEVDITQSIGKRYRRQDEIGTPYCITVDFESLEDNCVTIRDRDTMKQERISIDKLSEYFEKL